MSLVTALGVALELPNGRELFSNIHLSLDARLTALVGPNGVGKTCLAKLLAGELEPTSGAVQHRSAVAFFAQRQPPEPVSVAAFLLDRYQWSLRGEQLLEGLDREALCTSLSGGQWMRVRLACVLADQFLILDEPTNDLDGDGRAVVAEFLREHTGGALLVSHDRTCLALCEDVLELSNRGLAKFGGGWDAYTEAKRQERDRLGAALDLAKRERSDAAAERAAQMARQEKRNRRGVVAAERGGLPKILLGGRKRRAQVTTGKVQTTTAEKADEAVREAHEAFTHLKIDPVMYADLVGRAVHASKVVAEARGFNIRFGDRWLYPRDLDFVWRGNVRVALQGPNGSGKSSLLRALLGDTVTTRGDLLRGGLATLYLDQKLAVLDDDKTVLETVREAAPQGESELRNGLSKFLFAKDSVFQKVASLSGGERLRVALARGFLSASQPEMLVLDEPTNNLDLANVEFLEKLLRKFQGVLVVISHDEVFLRNCGITQQLILPLRA